MNQEVTEETIKNLMALKGEVRGVVFKTDATFAAKTQGEDALAKVEAKLKEWGCPLKYGEVNTTDFYPVGWRAISLLAIREALNFDDQKIREMGAAAPKVSLIIKLFMQYFLSIGKTVGQVPKMWRKHFSIGDLVPELDEKKKTLILKVENLNLHPIFCTYLTGYFPQVIEMVVKAPVSCEELKCAFRGDQNHEFLLKW